MWRGRSVTSPHCVIPFPPPQHGRTLPPPRVGGGEKLNYGVIEKSWAALADTSSYERGPPPPDIVCITFNASKDNACEFTVELSERVRASELPAAVQRLEGIDLSLVRRVTLQCVGVPVESRYSNRTVEIYVKGHTERKERDVRVNRPLRECGTVSYTLDSVLSVPFIGTANGIPRRQIFLMVHRGGAWRFLSASVEGRGEVGLKEPGSVPQSWEAFDLVDAWRNAFRLAAQRICSSFRRPAASASPPARPPCPAAAPRPPP